MEKCEKFRSCFESDCVLCETNCRVYGIDDRKKAVIKGKHNRKITFENTNRQRLLCCYKIDENHVIKKQGEQEKVCDNLLLVTSGNKQAVFVELKGEDIDSAVKQIRQTFDALKSDLTNFTLHGRIVNTRVPKVVNMRAFNELKLKFLDKSNKGTFEMRRDGYEEDIERL